MSDDKQYLPVKDRTPESMIKRMMDFAGPEHGTPYGLMMLRGELTKSQYSACNWFDELYRSYLRAIDGPRGIRTSTGQRIDAGHAPDPFSPIGWDIAADERNTVRAFDSARLAGMACGQGRFMVFWSVVINEDSAVTYDQKRAAAIVADALDKHRTRSWKSRRKK
jgi:hypothetical protein